MGALLVTALVLQAAYASRGWLVQAFPESRALILQVCDSLRCTMPPVRSLEGLTVAGSSLSLDADDGLHRLGVTLSNASELPAQAPALELTLLDGSGTVLARRALLPEEFSPAPQAIAARGDLSLQVRLDLKSLEAAAISTFRLAPFYP